MKLILWTLVLLLSACSIKNYEHTDAKIIIIKSPKIKFADLAYIRNSADAIELELFVAGKSIKKIAINHLVCVNEGCVSKNRFNKEYLSRYYPEDILQNILLGHTIYDAENRVKLDNGFEQKIVHKHVNIMYKVTNKIISFKDKKSNIIIKIKEIVHE